MKRFKRGQQGTQAYVNPEKRTNIIDSRARNAVDAYAMSRSDPDLKALLSAKQARDTAEMARLIPILRQKYGEKELTRLFKA